MDFKAVLFDMDGVLIDSMKFHVNSWQKAFKLAGVNVKTEDLMELGGVTFKETIQIISKKYGKNISHDKFEEIHDFKVKFFEEEFKIFIFDGVEDILVFLKKKGKKLAIVSSSYEKNVERIVEKLNYFDSVICVEKVKKGKPNPEPYLKAAGELRINPQDCIVVEDAPAGINAGKEAGMKVFALETTCLKEKLFGADRIFENQRDLLDFFELNLS